LDGVLCRAQQPVSVTSVSVPLEASACRAQQPVSVTSGSVPLE